MCNNYTTAQADLLRELASFSSTAPYPPEAWPAYDAPMILLDQGGGLECVPAKFGFAPPGYARPGMPNPVNVRAEEVTEKPMFADYWRRCQFCIVPAEAVFEPCWETGRNVRHRIWIKNESVFGIAGLWREWKSPTGGPPVTGFAMFTVNAENHAIFRRMHAPTERDGSPKEKRGVVMLTKDRWADWLASKDPEAARKFLRLYPAELMDCEPAPLAPRTKTARGPAPKPKPAASGDLF